MSATSRFAPRSYVSGVAFFTPLTQADLDSRYPNNGHGSGALNPALSAVLNSQLCTVLGLWLAQGSASGAGRFFLENHDGSSIYLTIKVPAALAENRWYRFGQAGVLVPGAFRLRWVADTPGTAAPSLYTLAYQDFTRREVN